MVFQINLNEFLYPWILWIALLWNLTVILFSLISNFQFQCHKGSRSEAVLDKEAILQQWLDTKTIVKDARYPVDNMQTLWSLLIKHHPEQLPDLIKLALIALVLPLHTAGCERVFSQQNIIVNKLRNRLSPDHSEKLLKIRLGGKGMTSHDFHDSLKKFHKKKRLIKSSI